MKRDEKNEKTRRKIIDRALREFSEKGYGGSSINSVSAEDGISKGIIYHYFASKDTLYLACVGECFQRLAEYIRENYRFELQGVEKQLEAYFTIRTEFFQKYPVYQRIFSEAVITPPAHLSREIQTCKADFDRLNIQILNHILSKASLRKDISREAFIEAVRQFQDFLNIRYQVSPSKESSFTEREADCHRILHILLYILLYGVIEREE